MAKTDGTSLLESPLPSALATTMAQGGRLDIAALNQFAAEIRSKLSASTSGDPDTSDILSVFRVVAGLVDELETRLKALPAPRSQALQHQVADLWGRRLAITALLEKWAGTEKRNWTAVRLGTLFPLVESLLLESLKPAAVLGVTPAVTSIIEWLSGLIPAARRSGYEASLKEAISSDG